MFVKIFFSYLIGYLRISIEGYYIERFINICKSKKIAIWNLKRDKDIHMEFNANINEFKEICKIAKKTRCKVKIQSKRGFPFLLHRYKKRKVFLVFLIIIVILIGLSSNYVWNVEITEENGEELENIYEDIENAGLRAGVSKSKINTKEIINKIRLERTDVAWMGIELKGTNAIVKLVKSNEKPEIIDESDYCSIVADKAGIITKINAQNGTANVKVGDTIKEGDTLINGYMEGKYTGVRYVHAKGEIEARVWYSKTKKILYNSTEKEDTGNLENKYKIKFNNFEINLSKKLSKFQIYDTISEENKIKIFSNLYLPISIIKTTNKEQKEVNKNYDIEEAKQIGIKELQEELENEIQKKENIVNHNINTYEKEDGIEVCVTYEVIENIGTNEKIVF